MVGRARCYVMSRTRSSRKPALLAAGALLAIAAILVLLLGSGDGKGDARARTVKGGAGHAKGCSAVAASLSALQSATAGAAPGSTVCLANGSYEELRLDAEQDRPGVTVRAKHPGKATIAGANLSGANLALARFDVAGEITIEPGSSGISVLDNRIGGGYFGLNAGPTTSTSISDTTVRGNRFVGPFGEDAIRLNRYHDSADPDPYGILIEANEITGVRENGNHSDCLQSVWGGDGLYFRRNYLHDNRCQGFFVKDQPEAVSNVVVADNLMLRDAAPCDPPSSDCGPPSIVQIFGPTQGLRLTRNTIWTPGNGSPTILREGPFGPVEISRNVIYRGWSDWSGGFPEYSESENTVCQWEGTLPRLSRSSSVRCSPGFRRPTADDYRLRSGKRGIDWSPSEQRYGPSAR
jgi:hypothetical protein